MATLPKKQSSVTLLHKGQGPSLFQFESRPFAVTEQSSKTGIHEPRPAIYDRPLKSPPYTTAKQPPKRIIVKCLDRQDANAMFEKRLQERAARHYRPSTATVKSTQQQKQPPQCDLYSKERMFRNAPHKPAGFPPPNFMPRWNPRHKDKTYLSKMVLEDPWSLPPEKRTELKKRTGLRLKSISRHYQYKLANLPFGKSADTQCTCHVEFCDHCTKSHEYRCPLHMQLLDSFEPDCKTELGEFCPFSRNAEDLPLDLIKDPAIYVTEVVRRLKAGEIRDVPPFPSKFLMQDQQEKGHLSLKNITASADPSTEGLLKRVAVREDSYTQTEPFLVDMDMNAGFKDNLSQTMKPDKETPVMMTSVLKSVENQSHYNPVPPSTENTTQVTPCLIQAFDKRTATIVKNVATKTLAQALQEISNEMRLQEIQVYTAYYTQQLLELQRTAQFKYMQEKCRSGAYAEEQVEVERQMAVEKSGEEAVCAIGFAMSFFWNFPGKVLDSLRREGYLINQDLKVMNTEVRNEFNKLVEEKLRYRDEAVKLLDEMVSHALLDVEMDAFRSNLVDAKYLDPLNWTTKFLRDLIVLRDNNFEMLRKIRAQLYVDGWYINDNGELVRFKEEGDNSTSDVNLDPFLKGIRVSFDSEGNPKYLVDFTGNPLPINVKWLPVEDEEQEKDQQQRKDPSTSSRRFDIVLEKKSGTPSMASKGNRSEKGIEEGDDVEREGEGLGLDWDYLGSDKMEDDDDDENAEVRLVFKRKNTTMLDEEAYDDMN